MPKKKFVVVLLLMGVLLSACNFPLAFDDPADVENAVAETVTAYETEEAAVVVVPTLALLPTSTAMPTDTPAVVEEEVVVVEATTTPCLSATAWDLTVPDNTKYAAGAGFDKAWTFKNVGTCDWTSDFKLVYKSGDQMNGPASKEIGAEVKTNGEIDVVLVLKAPSTAGTYRGNWMLQSAVGVDIGPVWVQIVVE